MKMKNGKGVRHLAWAAAAMIAMAGAAGSALAKEKAKKAETPGNETGNGYIGVYMQELTADVRKGLDLDVKAGVLVSGVEDDAPAELAGIEQGDVIVKFDGRAVSSPDELRELVRAVRPGDSAAVELVRDGKSQTLTLTVGDRPERHVIRWEDGDFAPMREYGRAFAMIGGPRLGVQAHELEDDGLASYFGAKKGEGVLVLSVDDESIAGKAGVQSGDIIRKIGDQAIEDVRDVRHALRDYDEGDEFDITVLRHGKAQSLKATMDDQSHEFAFTVPDAPQMHRWQVPRTPRAPRVWMHEGRDDLRRELDDLKKELQELKEELEERNDG
jgi:serine protease Do